jgi:hypothetical protein
MRSMLATAIWLTIAVIAVILTVFDMLAWYYGASVFF